MTITIKKEFFPDPVTRYTYDSSLPRHFAQIDTCQDASYYGNWASAEALTLISYCEGDVTTTVCTTKEEFAAEVNKLKDFSNRMDYTFKGIDPGWIHTDQILQPWRDCGLAHLIH
jgi:hypothetical protein